MSIAWARPFLIRSKHWLVKHAPALLMGMGTTGSISAVIFAVQATPKAVQAKKDAEWVKANGGEPSDDGAHGIFASDMGKLTVWETAKAVGPYYIPAIGMELFSLMCFWGAHGINVRRQAVLAGLYSTAEAALQEYQSKVVDMIGEKPEKEIRTAIAQDHIDRDPPPAGFVDSDEDVWCYYKGYKFRTSYNKLKEIQNDANAEMIRNLYLSESDLLWMFDPERKWIRPSNDSRNSGYCVDRLMKFDIHPIWGPNHKLAIGLEIRDENGREYDPVAGYSKSML